MWCHYELRWRQSLPPNFSGIFIIPLSLNSHAKSYNCLPRLGRLWAHRLIVIALRMAVRLMGGSAFTITFSLRPSERSPRSPRILFLISHIPRFNMPFIDLFEKWPPLISINLFSPDKQVNHIMRKSTSNLVVRLRF